MFFYEGSFDMYDSKHTIYFYLDTSLYDMIPNVDIRDMDLYTWHVMFTFPISYTDKDKLEYISTSISKLVNDAKKHGNCDMHTHLLCIARTMGEAGRNYLAELYRSRLRQKLR